MQERCYHRSHRVVIFAEYGLEHSKVELSHFENDLIEDFKVFGALRILSGIKEGSNKRFDNHVVSVQDLLR